MYVYTYTCLYIHVYTYIYIYMCICIHVYIHMCTYICLHMARLEKPPVRETKRNTCNGTDFFISFKSTLILPQPRKPLEAIRKNQEARVGLFCLTLRLSRLLEATGSYAEAGRKEMWIKIITNANTLEMYWNYNANMIIF